MNVRPDVVVADEPHPQRDVRLVGISHRRAHAGVRYRHDDIGINALLACKNPSEIRAHFIDALPEDIAVRTRKIDMLEDAVRERRRRERLDRPQAARADEQHLAGFDVANVGRADEIHGARFRADDIRVVELTKRHRAKSVRIADRDQAILVTASGTRRRLAPASPNRRSPPPRSALSIAQTGEGRLRCRCPTERSIPG